jgi:hypothetical protein
MEEANPRFRIFHGIFIMVCCLALFAAIIQSCSKFFSSARPQQRPSIAGYNPNLVCDDAFKNDVHYENDHINNFTVTLHEGCFSGYVYLPESWRQWWSYQPIGSDQANNWAAFWFPGGQPQGPLRPGDSYNFNYHPMLFRLQGHGTYRFYSNIVAPNRDSESDHTNQPPHKEPIDSPAHQPTDKDDVGNNPPPPPPRRYAKTPTVPASGQGNGYSFLLEECHRTGQSIECSAMVSNTTDVLSPFSICCGVTVDDEGNSAKLVGATPSERLMPGVQTQFDLRVANPHQNATKLNLEIHVHFEAARSYDVLTFRDIPIQ